MRRFNEQEIQFLIDEYSKLSREDIIQKLNRSWNTIQKKCFKLGLKRSFNESKNSFSLSKLLNFNNEDCYWIGFILADGHISKQNNIQINLSIKDKSHLYKFEEYLNLNLKFYESDKCIRLNLPDKPTILKIVELFKWKVNKTKNPPTIPSFINDDKLFSLIIGFIDGDGYIDIKGEMIRIKCDISWKNILEMFYETLTGSQKIFNITGDNLSYISIQQYETLNYIKRKCIDLNLPIMNRKWDRINLNKKHRIEINKEKEKKIIQCLKSGMKNNEIESHLGVSHGFVSKIKKKYTQQ